MGYLKTKIVKLKQSEQRRQGSNAGLTGKDFGSTGLNGGFFSREVTRSDFLFLKITLG